MIDQRFIAASPAEIGLNPAALDSLYDYVATEVAEGLPSAQVAIGRRGRLAGVRAFGTVTAGGVTQPAADDTLYCLYSATKGIVAVGIWKLIEDGLLRLDEKVAQIIPEFAGFEKDEITVQQVLTFTSGFPLAPMHPRLWEDREARLERMKGWRLNWEPGSRYQYHATPAHWVLVEIITRKTGLDFRDYMRDRITTPMGVPDLFVGLPDAEHHRAADVLYTYDPSTNEGGGGGESNLETTMHFNLPSQRRAGAPGAGGFAGAGELALFYQRLVSPAESAGFMPVTAATIEFATQVRTEARHTDGALPANRALSVVVAGDHPTERGFAPNASARAFGHGGAGGQIAWGDPETGLSVGFTTNAFVPPAHLRERGRTINRLAGECLA